MKNTSMSSLRKFKNIKYFQEQKGYETDYLKVINILSINRILQITIPFSIVIRELMIIVQ